MRRMVSNRCWQEAQPHQPYNSDRYRIDALKVAEISNTIKYRPIGTCSYWEWPYPLGPMAPPPLPTPAPSQPLVSQSYFRP